MAFPQMIIVNDLQLAIESEEVWNDVYAQLDNHKHTGRTMLRIQSTNGDTHVLLNDSTQLRFWIPKD